MDHNIQVNHDRYFTPGYGSLERFISYFYQTDAVARCMSPVDSRPVSLLEIGVGDGTVSAYLKKRGYAVTSCDFDPALNPDVVADVRSIPLPDKSFDVVMACEVLEHIPFADFEQALREMKRLSRGQCVISLPYRSTGFELVMRFPFLRSIVGRNFIDWFVRIPLSFGGFETSGQHYWEIDRSTYSRARVREVLTRHFSIMREGSPALDRYHYYFLLTCAS